MSGGEEFPTLAASSVISLAEGVEVRENASIKVRETQVLAAAVR